MIDSVVRRIYGVAAGAALTIALLGSGPAVVDGLALKTLVGADIGGGGGPWVPAVDCDTPGFQNTGCTAAPMKTCTAQYQGCKPSLAGSNVKLCSNGGGSTVICNPPACVSRNNDSLSSTCTRN